MHKREAVKNMPKFPKISFSQKDPVWIGRDEQLKILNAMIEQHRPIFMFMFESGTRHGENTISL